MNVQIFSLSEQPTLMLLFFFSFMIVCGISYNLPEPTGAYYSAMALCMQLMNRKMTNYAEINTKGSLNQLTDHEQLAVSVICSFLHLHSTRPILHFHIHVSAFPSRVQNSDQSIYVLVASTVFDCTDASRSSTVLDLTANSKRLMLCYPNTTLHNYDFYDYFILSFCSNNAGRTHS